EGSLVDSVRWGRAGTGRRVYVGIGGSCPVHRGRAGRHTATAPRPGRSDRSIRSSTSTPAERDGGPFEAHHGIGVPLQREAGRSGDIGIHQVLSGHAKVALLAIA